MLARLRAEAWTQAARPEQTEPPGDWRIWYLKGGRGSGKSRTGAETLAGWILNSPLVNGEGGDWAIIAPTYGDARDVCVESESGILRALAGSVEQWNRSTGELRLANGAQVFCDGADDGALRVQGKNLRGAWLDEIGLWQKGWRRAWEESIQFAVRIDPGKIVATGTPKAGHGLVKLLLEDTSVVVTTMRTVDNSENLSPFVLAELVEKYRGKRLGRQELEAEFLEDVEGALWSLSQIDSLRVAKAPPLQRIVVGVDPNVSSAEAANDAGVVVAGRGSDRHGYVLADRTITAGGPRAWARASVDAYHDWEADKIIAEKNNGGEMVAITIHTVDPTVPVKLVTATRGKRTRAEPVASLYEGEDENPARIHHVGTFPELEQEMYTWTPVDESPNRVDALVWSLTELFLTGPRQGSGSIAVASGRIPTVGDHLRVRGVR